MINHNCLNFGHAADIASFRLDSSTKSFVAQILPRMRRLVIAFCLVALALASNQEGLDFLAKNKLKEGVVELPSGLQYKVLKKGSGVFHPTADSPCDCHYAGALTVTSRHLLCLLFLTFTGTLIDGTEFDSSYKRGQPTTFAPNQVIKGWTEAMQLMVEGDKWEMYIPSELAVRFPRNSVKGNANSAKL